MNGALGITEHLYIKERYQVPGKGNVQHRILLPFNTAFCPGLGFYYTNDPLSNAVSSGKP